MPFVLFPASHVPAGVHERNTGSKTEQTFTIGGSGKLQLLSISKHTNGMWISVAALNLIYIHNEEDIQPESRIDDANVT
jgi:hypothetical protein